MRFGIFDHVERRNDVGQAQQYEERLQFAAAADAAGFYCYHVAEHHHSPLCLAPNQAVYLAAVAQRTQRLRLSTLVYVLPLHNPIRLIEEICLIDQLSNGRFEVGVGRGTDRAQEWRYPLLKTFAGRASGPGRDSTAGQNRRGYCVCEWGIGRGLASDNPGVLAALRGGNRRQLLRRLVSLGQPQPQGSLSFARTVRERGHAGCPLARLRGSHDL